jgi:hypothetical protein
MLERLATHHVFNEFFFELLPVRLFAELYPVWLFNFDVELS